MSDLKIKSYGSLAEYWFPHRPEYEALARLRIKLFDMKDVQEVLDYVQAQLEKIEKQEKEKAK
jgi:hypothetical protein|tara:strand:- start:2828 stop:3016 length:189 start_codon:yes stop_codon:yes gene_type:complete